MPSESVDRPPSTRSTGSTSSPQAGSGLRRTSRRINLEERLAWLERHVTEQDKAMLALGEELARLRAELKKIRERPAAGSENSDRPESDARPPHY
jgi:SlyX protein